MTPDLIQSNLKAALAAARTMLKLPTHATPELLRLEAFLAPHAIDAPADLADVEKVLGAALRELRDCYRVAAEREAGAGSRAGYVETGIAIAINESLTALNRLLP